MLKKFALKNNQLTGGQSRITAKIKFTGHFLKMSFMLIKKLHEQKLTLGRYHVQKFIGNKFLSFLGFGWTFTNNENGR